MPNKYFSEGLKHQPDKVWNGAVCGNSRDHLAEQSARKKNVLIIPTLTSWCKLLVNNHHFSWRAADFFHITHITMFCHGFPYWLVVWNMNFMTFLTSSTAQGGGGSFKNRKPIGDVGCCESGMAERSH